MQYINQSLSEGEEIVHGGYFHWMYNVSAVVNIVFGVILAIIVIIFAIKMEPVMFNTVGFEEMGWLEKIRNLHPGIKILSFLVVLMGLMRFVQMMIVKATTEIAITNKRLVYKRGLVARYVGEISIDRIEGVNVIQGVFGRIFDYGRVMVHGTGVGEVILPPIAQPVDFRKAIEKARTL